jgi:hypothetical protein
MQVLPIPVYAREEGRGEGQLSINQSNTSLLFSSKLRDHAIPIHYIIVQTN